MTMEHQGTREIETGRLILRRFELADAQSLYENWASDGEVTKFLRWEAHRDVGVSREVVASWVKGYESPSFYQWGITLRESGELIGTLGAYPVSEYDECYEIGYCIGRRFWGRGVMPEAVRAVFHFMLADVGINRVEAYHSVHNPASGRVMQKAGMKYEGLARQKYRCRLGFQDSRLYALVKDDFCRPAEPFEFLEPGRLTDGEIELVCTEKTPAQPEKQYVPGYEFELRRGGEAAGLISLRVGFNRQLYYGGHIGYEVSEPFRGHGYAERACRLLAPLARRHGFESLLITNSESNAASRRTCQKLGAKLVRIAQVPEWHEMYAMGRRRQCIWEWRLPKEDAQPAG